MYVHRLLERAWLTGSSFGTLARIILNAPILHRRAALDGVAALLASGLGSSRPWLAKVIGGAIVAAIIGKACALERSPSGGGTWWHGLEVPLQWREAKLSTCCSRAMSMTESGLSNLLVGVWV